MTAAKTDMTTPEEAFALAQALRDRACVTGALEIARAGLTLTGSEYRIYELATWTSDLVEGLGDSTTVAYWQKNAACVNRLNDLLQKKLGIRALVSIQNPVELDDYSEPQSDVVLLKRKDDYYESGHPQVEDILLLIEVADTTVESDRGVKIPVYAGEGIIEVWLVNLDEQCVEVYRAPQLNSYTDVQIFQRGQDLSIQSFPDVRITVEEVLG
jgi:Uma2 family endonuclease